MNVNPNHAQYQPNGARIQANTRWITTQLSAWGLHWTKAEPKFLARCQSQSQYQVQSTGTMKQVMRQRHGQCESMTQHTREAPIIRQLERWLIDSQTPNRAVIHASQGCEAWSTDKRGRATPQCKVFSTLMMWLWRDEAKSCEPVGQSSQRRENIYHKRQRSGNQQITEINDAHIRQRCHLTTHTTYNVRSSQLLVKYLELNRIQDYQKGVKTCESKSRSAKMCQWDHSVVPKGAAEVNQEGEAGWCWWCDEASKQQNSARHIIRGFKTSPAVDRTVLSAWQTDIKRVSTQYSAISHHPPINVENDVAQTYRLCKENINDISWFHHQECT